MLGWFKKKKAPVDDPPSGPPLETLERGTLRTYLQRAIEGTLPSRADVYLKRDLLGQPRSLDEPVCLVPDTAAKWLGNEPTDHHVIAQQEGYADIGINTWRLGAVAERARRCGKPLDVALVLDGLEFWIRFDGMPEPEHFGIDHDALERKMRGS